MIALRRWMMLGIVCSLACLLTACSLQEDQQSNSQKESSPAMQVQKMSDIDSGYRSSEDDWVTFLSCWRDAAGGRLKAEARASSPSLCANQVFLSGSSDYKRSADMLAKVESTIGTRLPRSYRDFALVTGGQWVVESACPPDGHGAPSNLSRISDIGRFRDVDKLNWGVWHKALNGMPRKEILPDVYYRYGYHEKPSDAQDDSQFRWEYIDDAIKVGELVQGTTILLNPREITADGEWEAWTLSPTWGAMRFRSFAELMQNVAYGDIAERGDILVPTTELLSTCARHLKTAANNS